MAVAVTIEQARETLSRLDPESRALLDLSVRRGMHDDEIADILRVEPSEVQRRVDEVLDRIAAELSLESREVRVELRATLPDLPPDAWQG
jgi:DNA-directed RNA polymerase specialized sigma24 family protein